MREGMTTLALLLVSLLIVYGCDQLPVISSMHRVPDVRQSDFFIMKDQQWQPVCPYCQKPLRDQGERNATDD